MERYQPLREYTWTVRKIRENMRTMEASRALGDVLERMPADYVIRPHLIAHKAEVIDMLLTEYNEADALELFHEEGRAGALLEAIANLMASTGCTAERAAEMLGIPSEERRRYLAII